MAQSPSISTIPNVVSLAATNQLGEPQAEFKVGYGKLIITTIIACFIGVLLFGFLTYATLFLDSSVNGGGVLILLLFTLFFLAGGLYYLLRPILFSDAVYLYTNGFIYHKKERYDVYRWSDLAEIWQQVTKRYYNGVYTGTTHKYTVHRKDGTQLILNDRFAKVEQLGNIISQQIYRNLFPVCLDAYRAGQVLTFGPVSISQQGVSNGKEWLPWQEVKDFSVNRGILTVKRQGKMLTWCSYPASKIPNLAVLMGLLEQAFQRR